MTYKNPLAKSIRLKRETDADNENDPRYDDGRDPT